jgi:prophage regulatory protein
MEAQKPVRLLRVCEVEDRVGAERGTLYKMVGAGTFPRPVKVSKSNRWVESEIDEWLDAKIQERGQA